MDKLILCLANSYKHGGRCIAGIEVQEHDGKYCLVRNTDGTPHWIRPISITAAGEILNSVADGIVPFDVLKITNVVPSPTHSHSENVLFSNIENRGKLFRPIPELLDKLIDNHHQEIFYSHDKAVPPETFLQGNYSLMLIKTERANIYNDIRYERSRFRIKFNYHLVEYDLPITDPIYINRLKSDKLLFGERENLYVVLSLGIEHEGLNYKLIPTVIDCPQNEHEEEDKAERQINYMQQQKQLHARAYEKWTFEDDEKLMGLYTKGVSIDELMNIFSRNRGSIESRIKKLSIQKQSQNQINFGPSDSNKQKTSEENSSDDDNK